ncbi:H(+)-transporting V1 sector ATPase subunit G [Sporobolomyces koalae]|uniref:H(+)-transporting V1 sector ATPase subunit G n=1 Tax=Sporobolomyces koalae TaxID=500713 RepID=UPI0031734796
MAANSQGIATLLDAEKEAAQIVAKAREYRTQRLKGAREEASKEVEALKKNKDDEFKQFESQHSNDNSDSQEQVNKSTQEQLDKIQASFDSNKSTVVDQLLDRVIQVKPEPHRNLQARA